MPNETLLRLPEVRSRTGFSRSRIYALMGKKEFPHPIRIGTRAVAWLEREINDWIQSRIRETRGAA